MNAPLTFEAVHARAHGRWSEILAALGIDPNALRNRHGPCPGCGGKDRFRFDDKDVGRFYCNAGGADPLSGDGFKLVQHVYGLTAREALERVAEVCGMDGTTPVPLTPRPKSTKPQALSRTAIYARERWLQAHKDDATVAAHPYAIKKDIEWAAGAGRAKATGSEIGRNADCIVIPIRTLAGQLVSVECINPDGVKQTFGSKGEDGCLLLGNTLDRSIPWVVVEGWADGVSFVFHIYRGDAVAVVAFGINRMLKVAQAVDQQFQPTDLVIVEDAACRPSRKCS